MNKFEVGELIWNAGNRPTILTVKLFERSLSTVVEEFCKEHNMHPDIGIDENEFREYWLDAPVNLLELKHEIYAKLWEAAYNTK